MDTEITNEKRIELMGKAASAFSPSAPIDQQALFAGRIGQLVDVMNTVSQKGQHAILFGERGVGKTSLATVIGKVFAGSGFLCAAINCDSAMNFSSIWHRALRQITRTTAQNLSGFVPGQETTVARLSDGLPDIVTPDVVREVLAQCGKLILIIDELDRVKDPATSTLLADTIKTLSDHAVPVTLILVGVAESVDNLIAEHLSVERALVQVRMPRMSKPELFEIITKGLATIPMTIVAAAQERIAALSQGLPHYTHLLALHSAQRALGVGRSEVRVEDVQTAIDRALSQAQQSIVSAYHRATSSPRENLYAQVLLACALAKPDKMGYFSAPDVRPAMTQIMKKPYDIPAFSQHLNAFCEDERGPVLQKAGQKRRFRFRFVNPLMQPYVIMDGLRRGLITHSNLTV